MRSSFAPKLTLAQFFQPVISTGQNLPQNQGLGVLHATKTSQSAMPNYFGRTNPNMPMYSAKEQFAERRSSAATYLVLRALVEILTRTTLALLKAATIYSLEEIAFEGIVNVPEGGRDALNKSKMRLSKWKKAAELLGIVSQLDFGGVSARFLRELKICQDALSVKGNLNPEAEAKTILMLRGMRHLRPFAGPETAWIQFCSCMQTVAEYFAGVHGQSCKTQYCRMMEAMLLRMAAQDNVNVRDQRWRKTVQKLNDRLQQLVVKPKYWQAAYQASSALACLSPDDIFEQRWNALSANLSSRLRERNNRATCLKSVCRLTWSYLRRHSVDKKNVIKSLEEIAKMIFFSGKKYSLSREPAITEPLIQLVRIIGHYFPDISFRTIIFPLISSDFLTSYKEPKIESLDPDRMIIGIKAFLAMISDIERNRRPPFPVDFVDEQEGVDELGSNLASPDMSKPKGRSRGHSTVKDSRLSQPVVTKGFSDNMKDHYNKFCEVLGKITQICDVAFGGQAVLDEKFSTHTPKTPISDAWNFSRREDIVHYGEDRHGFYDLLHVAVQALPRCLSHDTPIPELINVLCHGTAHLEQDIATSSAASLKSIARQGHAQFIVAKYSHFIMVYDNRYSTMSDGGLLGPDHIESTLTLYLELLGIWLKEFQSKAQDARNANKQGDLRNGLLDTTHSRNYVNHIESQGLFFLCSPSSRVRSFAINVLEIVTKLDTALAESNARIFSLLKCGHAKILSSIDHTLTVKERSHLTRAIRGNETDVFVHICRSGAEWDVGLWYKVFPWLVGVFNDPIHGCPMAVSMTRETICARLSHMQSASDAVVEERSRTLQMPAAESASNRLNLRTTTTPIEQNVQQWRLYLIFACTTFTDSGFQQQPDPNHLRKSSKSSQHASDAITNAADLFDKVVPLMFSENREVRLAAVHGLGCVNENLYHRLLGKLLPYAGDLEQIISKQMNQSARTPTSPRRLGPPLPFSAEVVHVYELTSYHLANDRISANDEILDHLSRYTRDLSLHFQPVEPRLDNAEVRRHYCVLLANFFDCVQKTKDPLRWISFQTRRASFVLLEEWQNQLAGRDNISARTPLEAPFGTDPLRMQDSHGSVVAAAAEAKRLRIAVLNTMASLCAGPMYYTPSSGQMHQFNVPRILIWIDSLLKMEGDQYQTVGKKALKNLITNNKNQPELLENTIEKLYRPSKSSTLESYLVAIFEIISSVQEPSIPFWKLLSALLFVLGDSDTTNRMWSVRLLQVFEDRHEHNPKLQDFSIGVSDKTRAVHKSAQYSISQKLAEYHSEDASNLFSEYSKYFVDLEPDSQRNMVTVLLPWMRMIELQLDPQGGATPNSYMILLNLLHITVKCSTNLHTEIQALWQALTMGPFHGNVRFILDFVVDLCLSRMERNFINTSKQIMVFIASTEAGKGVIDVFMQRIEPSAMKAENAQNFKPPADLSTVPYIVDMGQVFPNSSTDHQMAMSLGQLSLVLLVDLVVSDIPVTAEKLPSLLQAVLVLWDHHNDTVHEQAREMLIHLIHVLVISKIDKATVQSREPSVEYLVDLIRRQDSKVVWNYSENIDQFGPFEIPEPMSYVINETVSLFELTVPNIRRALGDMSLQWALNCRVKHLAHRSVQTYRHLANPMDSRMLSKILERLILIVSDEEPDFHAYTMELIRTLRQIALNEPISSSNVLPQLFWATCAGLECVNQWEYQEFLSVMNILLEKFELSNPAKIDILMQSKPSKWSTTFDGLANLAYKGCRSSKSYEQCLKALDHIVVLPQSPLAGDYSRLLMTFLANFPRFLHSFDDLGSKQDCISSAILLSSVARASNQFEVCDVMDRFAQSRFQRKEDFFNKCLATTKSLLAPNLEFQSLAFLIGLLYNPLDWVKSETLHILSRLLPVVDLNRREFVGHGADLATSPLRLVQSELNADAMPVLDYLLRIPGSATDLKHLHMSMVEQETSRDWNRQYDNVRSLYGIPDASGWSVPEPAFYRKAVRDNLTQVRQTFAETETDKSNKQPMPPKFYAEEQYSPSSSPHPPNGYFTTQPSQQESNMSQLVSQLDDLDEFFDDVADENPFGSGFHSAANTPPGSSHGKFENPVPTLRSPRSRRRQPSNSGDAFCPDKSRPPQPPNPSIMSPSAFSAVPPAPSVPLLRRPSMPSRSITSPAVNQTTPPDRTLVPPFQAQEPSSDDDLISGRVSTNACRPSLADIYSSNDSGFETTGNATDDNTRLNGGVGSSVQRSNSKSRFGSRGSIKRLATTLTSAADKHRRAATRGHVDVSPEVPRVPAEYLPHVPEPTSSQI